MTLQLQFIVDMSVPYETIEQVRVFAFKIMKLAVPLQKNKLIYSKYSEWARYGSKWERGILIFLSACFSM